MPLIWGVWKLLEPPQISDIMHDTKGVISSKAIWDKYTHLHETFSINRVNNNNLKRVFFT